METTIMTPLKEPAAQPEPRGQRTLRSLFGHLPFEMRITGRRRDLGIRAMDRLFSPPDQTSPHRSGHLDLQSIDTRDGHRFLIDRTALNERLLGYYYDNLLRHYRSSPLYGFLKHKSLELQDSRTFLDVGGNLGFYSLLARDAGFRTLTVEAEPRHAAFLQRHPTLFPTVFAVAVGEHEGSARFHVSRATNPGGSSMVGAVSGAGGLYDDQVTVQVQRLDRLLESLPDAGADLAVIKIDVEGFEAPVVRGLSGYLDKGFRPDIWCEVRGPESGRAPNSYREVSDCLAAYGYHAFDGERWPTTPFGRRENELPQVFDLLYRCPVSA